MHKTQNEQNTKPKPDDYVSNWLELFYLQAVLPEQNDVILLPTIKNSATPLFATCSGIPLRLATPFTRCH
jgi:hypothetical protein